MNGNGHTAEELLARWRDALRRRGLAAANVAEIEGQLQGQMDALQAGGLSADEAFLIALKRVAASDAATRDFALEYCRELWAPAAERSAETIAEPEPVPVPAPEPPLAAAPSPDRRVELTVVLALAVAAALVVQAPRLLGYDLTSESGALFYLRNAPFFILPFLAGYFAWKRRLNRAQCLGLALPFIAAAVIANIYPYGLDGEPVATLLLSALHLPIFLWLAVGLAYAGGRWRSTAGRMDFIRFSGELFIYYSLIAMGGGALTGLTFALFYFIDLEIAEFAGEWLLPGAALGAALVAAWLVESRQRVMENLAPLLARVFIPLVAVMLLAFLTAMVWTGRGVDTQREALIGFDLLLVLVLGLLLYGISARRAQAAPNLFDWLTALLVVSAIIADAVALSAIAARITEFGFSANKTAALGENLILLVNLVWSAWLYLQFLRGRGRFQALERWQTAYLPVYAAWALIVAAAFPPLFGFN